MGRNLSPTLVARWASEDESLIEAKKGDCASQALSEAYTMLRAVIIWKPILLVADSQLAFCGDALGVLHDAISFKARDPMWNRIMAELGWK